ncbi:hypothetical protein PMAYCL1PPCAC_21041, partial [Pristionchus mayeri]
PLPLHTHSGRGLRRECKRGRSLALPRPPLSIGHNTHTSLDIRLLLFENVMDVLSKAAPCRIQKDQLHQMLNRRVLTKERPVWDDTTRGMFIALLRQSSRTVPSRNFPVECTIDGLRSIDIAVFKAIAELMRVKEGFADFTEYMALEKWAWLCSMYAKAKAVNKIGNTIIWRYSNSMGFLGDDASTTQPFVDLLTTDTFIALCTAYNANENDKSIITAFNLIAENYTRRKSRRSLDSVVSAIRNEIEPPAKVQVLDMSSSISDAPSTRMTTRAQARTTLATTKNVDVKTDIKQEFDEKEDKFERADMEDEEVDFTGSCANGPTWTKEMIDQVVEEVKKRQSYWDLAHVDYRSITKRRDATNFIANAINTTHGTALTEKDISQKWSRMRGAFNKMVDNYSSFEKRPVGHFYNQMSFLLLNNYNGRGVLNTPSPDSSEERNTTPTVTVTEGPSHPLHLHEIFKGISHETPTKTTLKQMLDAGITLQPHSGLPSATSNGHLHIVSNSNSNRPSSYVTKESRRMDNEISLLASTQTDSWGVFGRLVEVSGREMNRASPALAIRMQRALHQVLHDFRLEGAHAGLQL